MTPEPAADAGSDSEQPAADLATSPGGSNAALPPEYLSADPGILVDAIELTDPDRGNIIDT